MMDESAAAGAFDKPLSAVTTGTEWMKAGWAEMCRQTTWWWQMEWRGDCKNDHCSICGIDNLVSAPHWEDLTSWQVGCVCLCHRPGEIRADTHRFLQPSRFWSVWLQPMLRSHMNSHSSAHVGVKVLRLLLITAMVPAFEAEPPNYKAQPQQGAKCPAVICQINYLSWACNCCENRYPGNCLVSCNVKWCFLSVSMQDERSKDCSVEICAPTFSLSLKIYAMDESWLIEKKKTTPWCLDHLHGLWHFPLDWLLPEYM